MGLVYTRDNTIPVMVAEREVPAATFSIPTTAVGILELETEAHRHPAPAPYPHCYGCGAENPIGLNLDFEFDGEELRARFVPLDDHQGYPGIVHGGVISSLLYEVMANIRRYFGDEAALRSAAVEFRRPAPVAKPLLVTARVVEETQKGWRLAADLTDENGRRLASATGEAIRTGGSKKNTPLNR